MSVIRNKHCLYDSLGEILKNHEKILGEESVIFHSLGGYRFQVIKFDNFIPSYALRGNTLDFDLFFENTGVRVTRIEENTKEEALKNTYQELKVKGFQMVIANCYHLPFDTINYKKNSDNHMLLIHNYDRNKKCFIVSDSAHRAEISIEDLMLARKKTIQKKYQYFNINTDLIRSANEIKININNQIISNAERFIKEDMKKMCEFKNELQKLGHMEKTMSKILSLGISRDLRGPHGVIMSRRIMSMTQPSSIENLEVDYIKLSELWLKLANYLVRFSLNNVNLETIVETYDQIVKNERDINYKLIKKRCINEN